MHIVQVANFVTPTSGGLRRTLEALGPRYVDAGHRCSLVVPGRTRKSSVAAGVRIEQLPGVSLPRSGGYRVIARRAPLQQLLGRLRPDVVELSDKTTLSWLPSWLARRGVPTVLLAHDRHDAMLDGTLPRWLPWRSVIRTMIARAAIPSAAIVCGSDFAAEQFDGVVDVVHTVPLGVDLDVFHPRRAPEVRSLSCGESIALAFVGRLSPEKRPEVAIETVRELVRRGLDVRLRVVGDGPLRGELEGRAIGLPIRFVGHLAERASVATILAGARVVIAPCGTETFGLAVLESMACGTPVVVPPDGGARELVAPGTGEIVTPDAKAFASAVARIVAADEHAARAACRSHAERFSWDVTAQRMVTLFERVVAIFGLPPSVPTYRLGARSDWRRGGLDVERSDHQLYSGGLRGGGLRRDPAASGAGRLRRRPDALQRDGRPSPVGDRAMQLRRRRGRDRARGAS
jgi:alpha-1,6-mannosyltransferase